MKEDAILEAVLSSWDKNNTILVNLLNSLPDGGLAARITETSKSVSEMFMHLYHERMISVSEEAPELEPNVPSAEWVAEPNRKVIEQKLIESAKIVRDAVRGRVETGRQLELNYDHPIHFIQLLIFHEAYHHGQIKSALKIAGTPLYDDVAGPLTWDVWRKRSI